MVPACNDAFLRLLRCAVDPASPLPDDIPAEAWPGLLEEAMKQSVAGVLFSRIEHVDKERMGIPLDVVLDWIGVAEQIKGQNAQVNEYCVKVSRHFEKRGYYCCILKGQGNALMYPDPLMRTSGDIDVWLIPMGDRKGKQEEVVDIVRLARKLCPDGKACYHHVDAGAYKGVEVEVHYRPSFMNSLFYNRRLQRWFEQQEHAQQAHRLSLPEGAGDICMPTLTFNRVFLLAHILNHVIHEGIGLRQLMDYYYLLRQGGGLSDAERGQLAATLKSLGLLKIAGAVMYVLREVFGLDERSMVVPADECRGRFLLDEMLAGGNFGHYDERTTKPTSQLGKNWHRLRRDLRLMRYFPSECLWEPVFRWYHFFWRQLTDFQR